MKKIYKYQLEVKEQQTLNLPEGAWVLSLQIQYGNPTLWALVDPSAATRAYQIFCYGTGHDVPDRLMQFLGTIQMGTLVWHFFKE